MHALRVKQCLEAAALACLVSAGVFACEPRKAARTIDWPEPLRRALEAASENIHTAMAEFVYTDFRGGATRQRYYTWRCAGGDILCTDRGDENGVLLRNEDGSPMPLQRPVRYLIDEGVGWEYSSGGVVGRAWGSKQPSHRATHDLRKSGINPVVASWPLEAVLSQPERANGPATFEQERLEDGTWHVAVHWELTNGVPSRWDHWIDSARDWNVVRNSVTYDGELLRTNLIDYAQVDGHWFPREVRELAGNGDVVETVGVIYAEVNRPNHPQDFTPADMGLEPGVFVIPIYPGAPFGVWDGQALIGPGEYTRRVELGLVQTGPTVRRELERLRTSADATASAPTYGIVSDPPNFRAGATFESKWEEYTRRLIEDYRLTTEQSQRALSILRDCQARAWDFLRRHREKFEAAERARMTPTASAPAARLKDLLAPIDAIFEQELKPRLEMLPTRAQRNAVADDAARRPADKP